MLGLIPTEKGADLVFHLGRSEYADESGPGGPPFRDSEIKGCLASFRQKREPIGYFIWGEVSMRTRAVPEGRPFAIAK